MCPIGGQSDTIWMPNLPSRWSEVESELSDRKLAGCADYRVPRQEITFTSLSHFRQQETGVLPAPFIVKLMFLFNTSACVFEKFLPLDPICLLRCLVQVLFDVKCTFQQAPVVNSIITTCTTERV